MSLLFTVRKLSPIAVAMGLALPLLGLAEDAPPVEYQETVDIQSLMADVTTESQRPALATLRHFADATSPETVQAGRGLYKTYCASCHGRQLQGQALWQAKDSFERLRAPPHDASGHTWQHGDDDLFAKVKTGHMDSTPVQAATQAAAAEKHAFGNVLSDTNIVQVLAFIKARWPLGIRIAQSTLNPGYMGMPPDSMSVEWTFPPTCLSSR